MLFLGDDDTVIKFHAPGPTSHARFMAKAIYVLKIFIFRDQFPLSKQQLCGLGGICVFLIKIYIKSWFCCANSVAAPSQDLDFIHKAIAYAQIDSEVSSGLLKKISNHMWYLSDEHVGFAFFDPNVSIEEKRRMVERMQCDQPQVKLIKGKTCLRPEMLLNTSLSDFVSVKTMKLFTRFGLSFDFSSLDPSQWHLNVEYKKSHKLLNGMLVVNDVAERGICFMKSYNRVLMFT